MSSRRCAWLVLSVALAGWACSDDERPPLRVGVVVDCVGINRSLQNAELSGAQLPLIERGAQRRGGRPRDGITPATIAGRPVELVPGCTEAFEFSMLNTELRRLAEVEQVDAIVAAATGADQIALRDVARRHPGVLFLAVVHGPRQATLMRTASNLFRFAGDHGQGVAGLATYAYRALGWRRAAIVLANWDVGWEARDAFAAEFCAIGGQITEQVQLDVPFDPAGRDVDKLPENVDGVAVFASQFFSPVGFLKRLARRSEDPAREIVFGPGLMDDPVTLRAAGDALAGVAGGSYVDRSRLREYLRAYRKAFPGARTSVARGELVTGYRDAIEALVRAFERAGGSTPRLAAELRRLRIGLLGGPVHLDDRGQAVITTSVVRVGTTAPVRRIAGVDQSLGGLLAPTHSPGLRPAACERRRPPPWAR